MFDISITHVFLVIIIGIVVGFINTLAGSGSVISLPLLIFLGLPPNVANGTNRIAILLQNLVGLKGFHKRKYLDTTSGKKPVVITVIGALIGASIAVEISNEVMEIVIGIVLVVMFFVILYKPERWLRTESQKSTKDFSIAQLILFFSIGLYGGFIQVGTGIFLLATFVLGGGYDLIRANGLKLMIMSIYTFFVLAIFIYTDNVNFVWGMIFGVSNMLGAGLATRFGLNLGPKFIRYILLGMITLSSLKLFGFFDWISSFF